MQPRTPASRGFKDTTLKCVLVGRETVHARGTLPLLQRNFSHTGLTTG